MNPDKRITIYDGDSNYNFKKYDIIVDDELFNYSHIMLRKEGYYNNDEFFIRCVQIDFDYDEELIDLDALDDKHGILKETFYYAKQCYDDDEEDEDAD